MPDPLGTLRNDIAELLSSNLDGIDMREDADQIVALLAAASGEQRRALLGILGYEVREGVIYDDGAWWTASAIPLRADRRPTSPCLILLDQRETTDD